MSTSTSIVAPAAPGPQRRRTWIVGLVMGAPTQPRWQRPAVLALLVATALLYLVDLSSSHWANSFYAAAVQAGTKNAKAWLFGSLDSQNAITVDKPPAALWVMVASGRVFGFNSWSMLAPQALEGIASVGLLYATVRRWAGPAAGLIAGAVLAMTPVAVLMFRFNNPDALLVLVMVASAYCVVRSTEHASGRWLVLAGVLIGFGFLTKLLQVFLVVPGFTLVYLLAAPTNLRRRIVHLAGAGLALIVSGGWYVALVALWPASDRPYIGGSTDNSLLELTFGYNGLGRIFGGHGNGGPAGATLPKGGQIPDLAGHNLPAGLAGHGAPGGAGGTMFGGSTGIGRLFGSTMGTEISWLLPAALIGFVAGLWMTRRQPRTDRTRAALILWGGWVVVTGLVFSYMHGIIHPYYTIALAPAIAATLGISLSQLWQARTAIASRALLAVMTAGTGIWAFVLLDRTPTWLPALRWVIVVVSIAVAGLLILKLRRRVLAGGLLTIALVSGLGATGAYAADTATKPHTGPIPTSGPSTAGGIPNLASLPNAPSTTDATPGQAGGLPSGFGPPSGTGPSGASGSGGAGGFSAPGGLGGFGGQTNKALDAKVSATHTRWAAATLGSNSAAAIELATGKAVIAIGGFMGTDPYPTLTEFKNYVAHQDIGYYIASGQMGAPGGNTGPGTAITTWVKHHYKAITIGGQTVYKLNP